MGGTGSGPRKMPETELKDALLRLEGDIPDIIEQLKRIAYGEPVMCPQCGADVGISKVDRDAAIYLIDRVLGKPRQVQTVDVTHTIELSADQCLALMERAEMARENVKLLPEGEDDIEIPGDSPESHETGTETPDVGNADMGGQLVATLGDVLGMPKPV